MMSLVVFQHCFVKPFLGLLFSQSAKFRWNSEQHGASNSSALEHDKKSKENILQLVQNTVYALVNACIPVSICAGDALCD